MSRFKETMFIILFLIAVVLVTPEVAYAGQVYCDPLPDIWSHTTCRYYDDYGREIAVIRSEPLPNISGFPVYRYENRYGNELRLVPRPLSDIWGNPVYDIEDY